MDGIESWMENYGNGLGDSENRSYTEMPSEIKEIWESEREKMTCYVAKKLGNRADAEEVVSATFVSACRSFEKFRGDCKVSTWVYTILNNLANNKYHSEVRRGKGRKVSIHDISFLSYDGPSPITSIEFGEFNDLISRNLQGLSENHKQILYLRLVKGLEYEECADYLRINIGTVKSRISRARESLLSRILRSGTRRDKVLQESPVELERRVFRCLREI